MTPRSMLITALVAAGAFSVALAVTQSRQHTSSDTLSTPASDASPADLATSDPLQFPADDFTVETVTVITASGEQQVTLHSYKHIPYVANPVDADYQSLDVQVPVAINGQPLDASAAPVLLNIKIGGYRSVNNANPDQGFGGRRGGEGKGRPVPGEGRAEERVQGTVQGTAHGMQAGMEAPAEGFGPRDGGRKGRDGLDGKGPGMQRGARMGEGMGSDKAQLALAAGYVVVTPGARGIDNVNAEGIYYGTAPAGIVDLKAAVRYIRHTDAVMAGNANWIVSAGCSAGGAMSALLGASGNQDWYAPYLKALGAADEPDNIFASACYSPITDLDHADMSYEWMFGNQPLRGELVDQQVSGQLQQQYRVYQAELALQGHHGFGVLTADNYADYLKQQYLQPIATAYIRTLDDEAQQQYLTDNSWIRWDGQQADFDFADYVADFGRMKGAPSFDSFELSTPENQLFGQGSQRANHFTAFSQDYNSASGAPLADELQQRVNMMNPMYFATAPKDQSRSDIAPHWWLRNGSHDNNNAAVVMFNLALGLEQQGVDVNTALFWEGGHCADDDPQGMVDWIAAITGYQAGSAGQ